MARKPPIPVDQLVSAICDDGSDFDDYLMGYYHIKFDKDTGRLMLGFERDHDCEADSDETDFGDTEYHFQLLADRP